jgi:hypothetical protein
MSFDPSTIEGGSAVVAHFGAWPSFHDAEVVSVHLQRSSACSLSIHAFNMTSSVDGTGHFITKDHGIVTFEFEEIRELQLNNFNEQNVIFGLKISHESDGAIKLRIDECYGLEGSIIANIVRVSVKPGTPSGGIYAKSESR